MQRVLLVAAGGSTHGFGGTPVMAAQGPRQHERQVFLDGQDRQPLRTAHQDGLASRVLVKARTPRRAT